VLAANHKNNTDMDVIFALAYIEGVSPVTVSLRKNLPSTGSPEADLILGVSSDVLGVSKKV
jgi:hypothetical protein